LRYSGDRTLANAINRTLRDTVYRTLANAVNRSLRDTINGTLTNAINRTLAYAGYRALGYSTN